jgi:ATP-dependent Clp protease ATP-binding subunit ClpA
VVFKTLRPEHLQKILEIELCMVEERIFAAAGTEQFLFYCTQTVKDFLLEQGIDPKYGARHLKRVIEKNIVVPLANLVATSQVQRGDFVRIDLNRQGDMIFTKDTDGRRASLQWERCLQRACAQPLAAAVAGY